ncbi:unnamed protein product [Thelazia callipaeda]|uniref:Apple domain-containing protein n=1 Tax=Thelazia callipaeda TaxID=103827 RepID=A0A0N5D0U0_THECL|nr:unnamed protein product [Thelazia callipaeda]
MDNEQCINACIYYQCAAINIFQLSEYGFMCEILATIIGTVPAQGAALVLWCNINTYNGNKILKS